MFILVSIGWHQIAADGFWFIKAGWFEGLRSCRAKPQHRKGEREQETNEANQLPKTRTHTIRPCFQNHTETTH